MDGQPAARLPLLLLLLLASSGASRLLFTASRTESGRLRIFLQAPVTGYIGFGLSLDGQLASSDVVIAWVDSDGQGHVFDGHGRRGRSTPDKDHSQDYEVEAASENATHTSITLLRAWDTCDSGDQPIVEDTMRLVWTLSDEDPGLFGWGEMVWSGPRPLLVSAPALPDQHPILHTPLSQWDVLAQEYKPVVEEGHQRLVSRVILYECLGGSEFEVFGSHPGSECGDSEAPSQWSRCSAPLIVAVSGSQGQMYPEEMGLPLAEGDGKATYFMLEIHYDNPALQRVRDSSGLSLFYTPDVRKYDGSLLQLGHRPGPSLLLPPHQANFLSRAYCHPHCTNLMLPETGVQVVGVSFHTHSTGRKVRLSQLRDSAVVSIIAEDNHFDPSFQEMRRTRGNVTILPGDDLVTDCTYSTLQRSSVTWGGLEAEDEECLAYVLYYPRSPLSSCLSQPEADFFFQNLGVSKFYGYSTSRLASLLLAPPKPRQPRRIAKAPLQSLLLRFSEKEGFNLDKASQEYLATATAVATPPPQDSSEPGAVLSELVIELPEEFQNKSLRGHLAELPWTEPVFTRRFEESLATGRFAISCCLLDSTPAMPLSTYNFPNVTNWKLKEEGEAVDRCGASSGASRLSTGLPTAASFLIPVILSLSSCWTTFFLSPM